MTRGLYVVAVVALFAASAVALASWSFDSEDDLFVISLVVGLGLVFGGLVGRWWALGLAVVWLPIALADHGPDSELSTFGVVWLTFLIMVPLQAAGLAGGVLMRRAPAWLRRRSAVRSRA